jgi:hypothetical protein
MDSSSLEMLLLTLKKKGHIKINMTPSNSFLGSKTVGILKILPSIWIQNMLLLVVKAAFAHMEMSLITSTFILFMQIPRPRLLTRV